MYKYRRIRITRSGYATVPGKTDEEALQNARNLKEDDFDWERVEPSLIKATAEVVVAIDPETEA